MPLVQVSMVEGRDAETKRRLVRAVTEAVVDTLGAPPQSVRVLVYELPPDSWAVGGMTKDDERS